MNSSELPPDLAEFIDNNPIDFKAYIKVPYSRRAYWTRLLINTLFGTVFIVHTLSSYIIPFFRDGEVRYLYGASTNFRRSGEWYVTSWEEPGMFIFMMLVFVFMIGFTSLITLSSLSAILEKKAYFLITPEYLIIYSKTKEVAYNWFELENISRVSDQPRDYLELSFAPYHVDKKNGDMRHLKIEFIGDCDLDEIERLLMMRVEESM